jgi:acyl-CoA thioester hydrolase
MRRLNESRVLETEIDTLGHMNVQYYLQRVLAANDVLMSEFGLGDDQRQALNARLATRDTYIRYHREQFTGSPLEVWGGALEVGPQSAKMYYEVRNPEKNDIAAAFVILFGLQDIASRAWAPLPAQVIAAAAGKAVEMPAHGAPRTIQLTPPQVNLTYDGVVARLGEEAHSDSFFGGRMERIVDAEACDEFGFLRGDQDLMHGGRRRELPPGKTFGPPTFVSDEGHRFAWAWLETRAVSLAVPRAGDLLRSIEVQIGIQSKTRHSRRWIFNETQGVVAAINDTVGIALDLDARKAIAIPTTMRKTLESTYLPELA